MAAYAPTPPLEAGRAPETLTQDVPPAPQQPERVYPPEEPFFFPPIGAFNPPGVLIIPPLPQAPCVPSEDEECTPPPPPPPPPEVPEPGTIFILLVGAAALWFGSHRRRRARCVAR